MGSLEHKACKASKGRRYKETEYTDISAFGNDMQKIYHSKALRRLQHKTQVWADPSNSHARNRDTHTKEVCANSTVISELLGLNTSLCQSIALAHDIGHVPFGHAAERKLTELSGKEFRHGVFGVVLAQHIERKGQGLNLTHETLEGILSHSKGRRELIIDPEKLLEYSVVMFADKISYLTADLNDALRYGALEKIPKIAIKLGRNQRERTEKLIQALVSESLEVGTVKFKESDVFHQFEGLRQFMYDEVYLKINTDHQMSLVNELYNYFEKEKPEFHPVVVFSLLTDQDAKLISDRYFLSNHPKPDWEDFKGLGFYEVLEDLERKGLLKPYNPEKNVDYSGPEFFSNPDLDWKIFHKANQ